MKDSKSHLQRDKQLMAALLRMPPKPHDEMKLGKRKAKSAKSPGRKKKAKKPD